MFWTYKALGKALNGVRKEDATPPLERRKEIDKGASTNDYEEV